MKKKVVLQIIALIILFSPSNIFSQLDFSIGTTSGYIRAMHNTNYRWTCDPICFQMQDLATNTGFGGISTEISILKGKLPLSFISRIMYEDLSFKQTHEGDKYPSLIDDGKGGYITTESSTGFDYIVDYKLLTSHWLFNLKFFNSGLSLFAGPSVSTVIQNHYKEKYYIVKPPDVQFKRIVLKADEYGFTPYYTDRDRTYMASDNPIRKMNNILYGIVGGLQWEYSFWNLKLAPFIAFDYILTDVVKEGNPDCPYCLQPSPKPIHWNFNMFFAGLDIRYNL